MKDECEEVDIAPVAANRRHDRQAFERAAQAYAFSKPAASLRRHACTAAAQAASAQVCYSNSGGMRALS
jgi:hypothetical protein